MEKSGSGSGKSVRSLIERGQSLHERLEKWGGSGSARLQKKVRAELTFLNRLSALPSASLASHPAQLRSTNFDHLEDVFEILQHPLVNGVSAVMKNFDVGGSSKETAHVDIACLLEGKPVWLIVFSRNGKYIRWVDSENQVKGLRSRILLLLQAACSNAVKKPNSVLFCFTGEVPEDVDRGLRIEFRALHLSSSPSSRGFFPRECNLRKGSPPNCSFSEVEGGEWVDVEVKEDVIAYRNQGWETYEVDSHYFEEKMQLHRDLEYEQGRVEILEAIESGNDKATCSSSSSSSRNSGEISDPPSRVKTSPEPRAEDGDENFVNLDTSGEVFQSPSSVTGASGHSAEREEDNFVNLDTTALVAMVSEVSNGGANYLLALTPEELEGKFPSMSGFIRQQALSELDRPLVPDIEEAMKGLQPVVSQFVYDEFLSIVSQIGGPKENERAQHLLQRVKVIPNTPSERVMSLPQTGRIKMRHKIVFGTGDYHNASTLTANVAFARAAMQQGMAIAILEHRPRALTGD